MSRYRIFKYGVQKMSSRRKKYWVVEVTNHIETVLRKRLPGNLSKKAISTILQRLASRDLSPLEVIAVSIPATQTLHLNVQISRPPQGKRTMIWLPAFPAYKAGYWCEDELEKYPEILPKEL